MLEPHQIQPGALDEDRAPLWLVPDEGGDAVRVLDRFQANAGAYLIAVNEAGAYLILPEGAVLGDYSPRESESDTARDAETERLETENEQLRAQLAAGNEQAAADLGHDPTPAPPAPAAEPVPPAGEPAAAPIESPTPGA